MLKVISSSSYNPSKHSEAVCSVEYSPTCWKVCAAPWGSARRVPTTQMAAITSLHHTVAIYSDIHSLISVISYLAIPLLCLLARGVTMAQ